MSAEGPTPGSTPMNAMASMEVFMVGLEKSLGHALKPLEKVTKQVGGSKFGKNVKKFGSAMKGMAGASVQAWAMQQLMKLIEPFLKLLELFEIPINVLAALLNVFVNEIFVALLPFFLDFSMLLLDLMPIFKFLGKIVGVVLVWALNLIIERFRFIYNFWKEIIQFLAEKFGPTWVKIKAIFVAIGQFIGKVFGPLWNGIIKLFKGIKQAWKDSGGKIFGKDGFIAKGFKALVEFGKTIVNWFIGIINKVINFINKIPGVSLSTIPLLQEGGFITQETLAVLHPNEVVIPLDRMGDMGMGQDPRLLDAMEENNRLMGVLIKQNKEQLAWRF